MFDQSLTSINLRQLLFVEWGRFVAKSWCLQSSSPLLWDSRILVMLLHNKYEALRAIVLWIEQSLEQQEDLGSIPALFIRFSVLGLSW